MKSLWPFGLTGRVVAILIVTIVILAVGGIGLHIYERATGVRAQFVLGASERISAVTTLIDQTPHEDRGRILQAMRSRWLQVRLSSTAPAPPPESHPSLQAKNFSEQLREHLIREVDGRVEVFVAPHDWRDFWPHQRPNPRYSRGWNRGREIPVVTASVALSDGSWLVFGMPMRMARLRWEIRLISVIGVSVLIVILVAVWAARRVTRPVAQLAEAAERFGADVRAAPMPETGSREIRLAARAFNRMQERLRRLIDDRTFMLAAISHDLRTVLTRLKLRAEYVEDENQRMRAIADIDEMQAMLETSLAFARDELAEEARRDVDISALLQSLCDGLSDAGEKASFDGPAGLICHCQPVAMRRAVSNLLGNAVKYGKEVEVVARRDGAMIGIDISDRGPGIAELLHEKVFMPFYRIESSRNRETGGTGLGMSVARNVFRRHGGDITLHPRPGGGLRVRAIIPA
jgi:signal transduction histidine kinase